MKAKTQKKSPVYSYAILPDGTVLPVPGCNGYIKREDGITLYNAHPDNQSKKSLVLLPPGSTLVTNWNHPDHA